MRLNAKHRTSEVAGGYEIHSQSRIDIITLYILYTCTVQKLYTTAYNVYEIHYIYTELIHYTFVHVDPKRKEDMQRGNWQIQTQG